MMYRWRKTIALGLLLVVLTAIVGFAFRYVVQNEEPDELSKKTFQFEQSTKKPPESDGDSDALPDTLIGNVRPFRETTVSAPVNGTIRKLNVREGQEIDAELIPERPSDTSVIRLNGAAEESSFEHNPVVNLPPYPANQVLVRLDVRKVEQRLNELNAEIQKTRLQLRDARRTERRVREAFEEGGEGTVYSQSDLDDAVLKVNVTEKELERLRSRRNRLAEQAKDHYLHAPYPGVVEEVHTEVGEWLSAGQPVFTLMDLSRVKVEFYVTERMEPQIRERERFTFTVDAFPDRSQPFEGQVYSIAPATDADHHRFKVVLSLQNPDDARLKPGMICRVHMD